MKLRFTFLFFITFGSVVTFAQDIKIDIDTNAINLDEVIISANTFFGNKSNLINRTGSGYFLSSKELEKQSYTDVSRILSKVPGVNSFDEDGFGLRPNISLRGVSAERSAKISLMEDGVLIAPAPYSAPAAYYFPMIQRMAAIEVLKGSSQIEFGPFTTGGAINFVSSSITSNRSKGFVKLNYGSYGNRNIGFNYTEKVGKFAYLVEGYHQGSNGFKNLPNNDNTGFNKFEFLTKLRYTFKNLNNFKQFIEVKAQYSTEVSNETYLGLTVSDFESNPFDRYLASSKDQMNAEHFQLMATHTMDVGKSFRITTVAYNNEFHRNWYKLNDVNIGSSKIGIANVLNYPSEYKSAINLLKGIATSPNDLLNLKNNNRTYSAKGVQTKLAKHWSTQGYSYDIELGLKYHYDDEDRFQWVDSYSFIDNRMSLQKAGIEGTDANKISSAHAFSAYTLYKLNINSKVNITPGIRYENINLKSEDYGKSDVERNATNLSIKTNNVSKLIPGIGVNYRPSDIIAIFAGVHRGFSPPGIDANSLPESSVNSEIGIRVNKERIYLELVGYKNKYSNLLGSDLAASGGTGTLNLFNAGAVDVDGLEFLLNYDLINPLNRNFKLPIEFSYTLTRSNFLSDFESQEGIWGNVIVGDELPYIPKHQFYTSLGYEIGKFGALVSGRHNGQIRTVAGKGEIDKNHIVPAYFVMDFASNYQLNKNWRINLNVINLMNSTYLVSRVPSGLRPGHPFALTGGFVFQF